MVRKEKATLMQHQSSDQGFQCIKFHINKWPLWLLFNQFNNNHLLVPFNLNSNSNNATNNRNNNVIRNNNNNVNNPSINNNKEQEGLKEGLTRSLCHIVVFYHTY